MYVEDDEYYKDVKKVFQENTSIVDDNIELVSLIDDQNEINNIDIR